MIGDIESDVHVRGGKESDCVAHYNFPLRRISLSPGGIGREGTRREMSGIVTAA
jgi:hypothetical protein